MIQLLIAFVGGIVTLVPVLFVSPRRRELHFVRDEAAVIKDMEDSKAKRLMEEAHAATAEAYRRRVKGLDRVEIFRRRVFATVPFVYVAALLLAYAMMRRDDIAGWLDVKEQSVSVGLYVISGLVSLPAVVFAIRLRVAVRERDKQVEAKVEEFENRVAQREAARKVRESLTTEAGRQTVDRILKNGKLGEVRVSMGSDGKWVVVPSRAAPKTPGKLDRGDEPDATDGGAGVPVG